LETPDVAHTCAVQVMQVQADFCCVLQLLSMSELKVVR